MAEDAKRNVKLTPKQAKFVRALAEGKSGLQAALEAYDTTDTNAAAVIAYENIRKLNVKEALDILMDAKGLSTDKLLDSLKDGMDATKTIVMGKDSNESFVDIQPDYQTRHKYLETALRLKNMGTVGSTLNVDTGGGEVKVVVMNYGEAASNPI